jgi:hypothetical protein
VRFLELPSIRFIHGEMPGLPISPERAARRLNDLGLAVMVYHRPHDSYMEIVFTRRHQVLNTVRRQNRVFVEHEHPIRAAFKRCGDTDIVVPCVTFVLDKLNKIDGRKSSTNSPHRAIGGATI